MGEPGRARIAGSPAAEVERENGCTHNLYATVSYVYVFLSNTLAGCCVLPLNISKHLSSQRKIPARDCFGQGKCLHQICEIVSFGAYMLLNRAKVFIPNGCFQES